MIRAAICDDEPTILDYLHEHISKEFKRQGADIQIDKFTSGKDFLKAHKAEQFDVAFLDIKMPDIDGFEVAKELRGSSDNTKIIFVTTEDGLVYDSFDYQPFWFIPKTNPEILKTKLKTVIQKLIDKIAQNRKICLKLPHGEEKYIYSNSILYIYSQSNYLNIVTESETINIREKINVFFEKLPQQTFVRIHNRYIVNMQQIAAVDCTDYKIVLKNEEVQYVSRAYKSSFLEHYNLFQRNFT